MRSAEIKRKTLETSIKVKATIDGEGICEVETGIKYLDHMITTLSKHSLIDLKVKAKGDLQHHIVEDIALALGDVISKALEKRDGINRFGNASVPMDDSLASVSLDLVKRPYSRINLRIEHETIEDMFKEDIQHFLKSFIQSLEATVHINVEYGDDDHHKVEAAFKALALSIKQAVMLDPRRTTPPSAKGVM